MAIADVPKIDNYGVRVSAKKQYYKAKKQYDDLFVWLPFFYVQRKNVYFRKILEIIIQEWSQ